MVMFWWKLWQAATASAWVIWFIQTGSTTRLPCCCSMLADLIRLVYCGSSFTPIWKSPSAGDDTCCSYTSINNMQPRRIVKCFQTELTIEDVGSLKAFDPNYVQTFLKQFEEEKHYIQMTSMGKISLTDIGRKHCPGFIWFNRLSISVQDIIGKPKYHYYFIRSRISPQSLLRIQCMVRHIHYGWVCLRLNQIFQEIIHSLSRI